MAIAFDASTVWQFATTTSLSWSHTCTGANGILFVGVKVVSGSDVVTGVTYNSVAMTRVEFQVFSGQAYYLYVLAGPATGANNVVVSVSSSLNTQARSVSYTGAKQTNTVDNHSNNTQASGTSIAGTLTTVADNCWVVGFFQNNIDTGATAGANTTLRSIDGTQNVIMGDSNAAKTPAGSVTLNYQWTGTATGQVLFASFAPVPPVSPTVSYDWPNPRRVVPSPQRFSVEGNRNQALFFVPPPPPSISTYGWNWPNPVRRVNAPAWQQSLTGSLVIPRDADYFYGLVWISVDGVARAQGRSGSAGIDFASLTISDELDQTPNTCQFVARGFTPTVGQTVIATLGSATIPNPERIFAGTILRVQQVYSGTPANQSFQVSCIDWTWQLSKRKVIKQYTGWTATAIAIDLMANYTSGFTVNHVAGLGVIDAISFTNVDLTDALTQLAKRAGGYWYVDYNKDLHFYVTEGVTPPTPLTASHPSLSDFSITRDLSQWITRQYSEGGGSNAATAVAVGGTTIPVVDISWYSASGGLLAVNQQRISYTGITSGATTVQGGASTIAARPAPSSSMTTVESATAASFTPGSYTFFSAFLYSDGTYSTVSPGNTVTLSGNFVPNFANIPTGDGRVTQRRVYFQFGGVGAINRWNDVADNSTTSSDLAAGIGGAPQSPAANYSAGVSYVYVADCAQFLSSGGSATVGSQTFTYTGRSASSGVGALTSVSGIVSAISVGSTIAATIPAGATSLPVVDTTNFSGSGGTARIGSQTFTYTNRSAASGAGNLTGIPSTGVGSLSSAVFGGDTVIVGAGGAGTLSGIPASGDGSVLYAVSVGDPINLVVKVDDIAGQSALAALIGGDGVQEDYVIDGRIAYTEALARANARIALNNSIRESIAYVVRDQLTRSGKTIVVNLVAPMSVTSSYKIQRVTITQFSATPGLFPTYTADASSDKLSFEDELKNIIGGTT